MFFVEKIIDMKHTPVILLFLVSVLGSSFSWAQTERLAALEADRFGSVEFPLDLCQQNAGSIEDLMPENLPDPYAFPRVAGGCEKPKISYTDISIQRSKNRIEILRKWEVCNPCIPGECYRNIQLIKGYLAEKESGLFPLGQSEKADQLTLLASPNPFIERTIISFFLPVRGWASLSITNADGRVIFQTAEVFDAGNHQIELGPEEISWLPGLFICTLQTRYATSVYKLVCIR